MAWYPAASTARLRRVVAMKKLESLVAGTKIVRDERTGATD